MYLMIRTLKSLAEKPPTGAERLIAFAIISRYNKTRLQSLWGDANA